MSYREPASVPKEEVIVSQKSFKEELKSTLNDENIKAYKYLPRVLKKIKKLCIEAAKNGEDEITFGYYNLPWFTSWSKQLHSLLMSTLSNPPYNLNVSSLTDDFRYIFIKWKN